MIWAASLSLVLGALAVFQAGINRQISEKWGLTPAVVLNNLVIFLAGSALYFCVKFSPSFFPSFFKDKGGFQDLKWWYLLPGLFGLSLVAGIPFLISKIGALRVFVGIVAGQMMAGLLFDYFQAQVPFSTFRLLGALLTIVSVFLVNWRG